MDRLMINDGHDSNRMYDQVEITKRSAILWQGAPAECS
jgi:hypothetical protein